jgi:hypothetical protein
MFATSNGEKREEVRRATLRANKYRARAAENLRLADSALFREVRDHRREVARYYIQLAEKEKPSSVKTVTIG